MFHEYVDAGVFVVKYEGLARRSRTRMQAAYLTSSGSRAAENRYRPRSTSTASSNAKRRYLASGYHDRAVFFCAKAGPVSGAIV